MELKNYVAQWAGEVLPGATCYLYHAGTETLASGLQDAAGAALANPFQAGSDGLIQFAAPNGEYDLRVMSGGRDSRMRVQCLDVAEQLAAAQGEADRAAGQADRAVSEADRAGSEATRAESARDAAMAAGDVYVDTAAGLAATTSGQYFMVPSAESTESLMLYRNNAGAAQDAGKSLPSTAAIDKLKKVGRNIYDGSQPNHLNTRLNTSTGGLSYNSGWADLVTHYIPVSAATTYILSTGSGRTVAQYNSALEFISPVSTHSRSVPITTAENAAYIRVQLYTADLPTMMIEAASTFSVEHVPYEKLLDTDLINKNALLASPEFVAALPYLTPVGNIFDASLPVLDNRTLDSAGLPVVQSGRILTGFIRIKPSTMYATNTTTNYLVGFYDARKVYLGDVSNFNKNVPLATPANAEYIRAAIYSTQFAGLHIEEGATVSAKSEYELGYTGPLSAQRVKDAISWANNDLAMPSRIYMLENHQNNIYYQHIQRRTIKDMFFARVGGSGVINRTRQARVTPTAAGDIALTSTLYDAEFDVVKTVASTAVVKSKTTPTTPFKLLAIGDSMTFEGYWLGHAKSYIPDFTTLGIRAGANITTVMHEGRSGWSLANYFEHYGNIGFSGFTPFMHPIGAYRYIGTTRTWKAVAATPTLASVIGMTAIYATLGIDASGRPTKDPGQSTLAAGAVVYNNDLNVYQQWDGASWTTVTGLTFEFNFGKYLSTFGVETPDAVSMMLGYNDFSGTLPHDVESAFATWKGRADTVIASAIAAGVSKFAIVIPQSVAGLMEDPNGSFTRRIDASLWEMRRLMIKHYDNRIGEGIYLVDAGSALDPDYGIPLATWAQEKPFSEYAGDARITPTYNAPHPDSAGYAQIAVRIAAWIQAVR